MLSLWHKQVHKSAIWNSEASTVIHAEFRSPICQSWCNAFHLAAKRPCIETFTRFAQHVPTQRPPLSYLTNITHTYIHTANTER